MGYMRHHAIVVTSWDKDLLTLAHTNAKTIFGDTVSNIVGSFINGYASFFIAPDGSKEGWDISDEGDSRRAEFIEWMEGQAYSDYSTALGWAWVEIQFDDDNLVTKIVRDNQDLYRENKHKLEG